MLNNTFEILISTANQLHLIKVARDSFELVENKIVHSEQGFYFGITFDAHSIYVLCRNYEQQGKGNSVLVFDRAMNVLHEISLKGIVFEGHQMVLRDGALYICNTNKNCITRFAMQDRSAQNLYPVPKQRDRNLNHFNSICISGSSMYLLAANRFRNSFLLEYDYQSFSFQSVDAIGLQAHNVVPTPDGFVICDSFHGALAAWRTGYSEDGQEFPLHSIFLLPDEEQVLVQRISQNRVAFREQRGGPVFPRGLAIADDVAIIGLTEWGKRTVRRDSIGRIMLLGGLSRIIHTGECIRAKTIDLGTSGAVMDVRVLNAEDLGHPLPSDVSPPRGQH